jgi:hypothetical protein
MVDIVRSFCAVHTSRVIEIDGVFAGAAIGLPGASAWRFVPAHERLAHLSGTIAPSFEEIERLVRGAYFASRSVKQPAATAA